MKLTIRETAKLLDLPAETLERWIRQGRIPVQRSGSYCFFRKSNLKKWADAHGLSFSKTGNHDADAYNDEIVSLFSAMESGGIFYDIKVSNIEETLQNAVSRITFLNEGDKKILVERLVERENLTSTGIGNGVAIPHPRSPLNAEMEQSSISTFFLEEPVDFNSVDDKPVFILFLLVSTSVKSHLHLLSQLSFCVRDRAFVDFLKSVPGPEALLERIDLFQSMEKR